MAKKCSASFPLRIGVSLIGFAIAFSLFISLKSYDRSDIERLSIEMHYRMYPKSFLQIGNNTGVYNFEMRI